MCVYIYDILRPTASGPLAVEAYEAIDILLHTGTCRTTWPLHNIAIAIIVWCMTCKGGVGVWGGILPNGRAIVLQ